MRKLFLILFIFMLTQGYELPVIEDPALEVLAMVMVSKYPNNEPTPRFKKYFETRKNKPIEVNQEVIEVEYEAIILLDEVVITYIKPEWN